MVTERSSQHWDTPSFPESIPTAKVKRKGPEPKFRAKVVRDGDQPWADYRRNPINLSPIVVHRDVLPVHFVCSSQKRPERSEGSGRPGTPWTDAQYATALRMYREGKSLAEIGDEIGRSDKSVQKMMSKKGVKRPRKPLPKREVEPTFWKPDKVAIIRQMAKEGYYLSDMAEEFNLRPESIRRVCRIHKIQYRRKTSNNVFTMYTPEEDAEILRMWKEKIPVHEIAKKIGRSRSGVYVRLDKLRGKRK